MHERRRLRLYDAKHYEPEFGPPADGFRGFTIAVNLESFADVKAVYETLQGIDGVELLEEPAEAFWAAASAGAIRRGTSGTSPGRRARPSTSAAA